ncbi:MAG: ComEC/Rec2 family competence protein [Candidatus Pacebacteria bacterium]|nr:ComEC/Rec2 family competence protein [Candidatus Paceibacterota bacterium]
MDNKHAQAKSLDYILFTGVLGICAGIIFASFVGITPPILLGIGGVAILIFAFCFFLIPNTNQKKTLLVPIFLFASLVGIVRMEFSKPATSGLLDQVGEKIILRGVIDAPETRTSGIQFSLDIGEEKVLVSTKKYTSLLYGDEVEVTGKLMKPENFMTDQGTEFDYISYLYKDDILYRMSYANVTVLSHGHGNRIVATLLPVRDWFLQGFNRVLPVRHADLLGGIVLGVKQNISQEFRNDLVTTGTIHIIALSGYNVTIIANALRGFFVDILGLSIRLAGMAGAFCIVIFVVMTGLQSSAVRAGIMGLIGLFARTKGRTYDAFRALVFAGILMILWNPKYLVYDVSFQLSFLATLGIIFVTPILERKFSRIPKKVIWFIPLRELMSVTLGAQIGVYPFILYKMGTLSIISLPANILILPAVPFAMGFGTLAGVLGSVSIALAHPFILITNGLLSYTIEIVKFFAKVPFASVVFKQFPIFLCVLLYIVIGYFVWRSRKSIIKNTQA